MKVKLAILSMSLFLVVGYLSSAPAWSQGAAGVAEAADGALNYFDFFVVKGGLIAYALIVISVVTAALFVEHLITIRRATILPQESADHARDLLDQKKYAEAIQFAQEDPSVMGYCLHAGLMEASNGFEAMERAVEEALDERSARLFRKIEYLNIIGNVSPMIGLFGTVYGMILLFAEIHAADGLPGARIVADRMAVALITTFWGLAVAIPALSIFAWFRNRIDVLTAECALSVDRMLATFGPGGGLMPTVDPRAAKAPPTAVSAVPARQPVLEG